MPGVRDQALVKSIAAEVKARRTKLEISQEELAHRCGLQPLFIVRIETAANQPSATTLVMLAHGLGVEPEDFLASVMVRYRKERRTKPSP